MPLFRRPGLWRCSFAHFLVQWHSVMGDCKRQLVNAQSFLVIATKVARNCDSCLYAFYTRSLRLVFIVLKVVLSGIIVDICVPC